MLLVFVGLIWAVAIVDTLLGLGLGRYGIEPRTEDGLRGILFHVFLHQGLGHVLSNTGPLLVLGTLISLRGDRKLLGASLFIVALGGFAVWLVGRSGVHIGASGLAFGYLGYLVGRGFYERNLTSILIAVAVVVFYGGMLFSILPSLGLVSWEGHLFGLIAGVAYSRITRARTHHPSRQREGT